MLNRRDTLKTGLLSLGSFGVFGDMFTKTYESESGLTPSLVEGERTWQNFDKNNLNFDVIFYMTYKGFDDKSKQWNWVDIETNKELPFKNYYKTKMFDSPPSWGITYDHQKPHNTSYAINSDATFETDILFDVNFDLTGTLRYEINANI